MVDTDLCRPSIRDRPSGSAPEGGESMRRKSRWAGSWLALTLAIGAGAEGAEQQASESAPATPEELERRLDEVLEQNQRLQESVRDLQQQVGAAVAPESAPPPTTAGVTPLF